MFKKYIKRTFFIIIILLSAIALISIIADPGKIYMKKFIAQKNATSYVDELLKSKNGLSRSGWNERLVKTTLAKRTDNYDCVILGSSHIKQISNIQNTGNIQKQCKSLLNLGVNGCSIEDIFMFSYFIFQNDKLPKKLFIGIDPWTLKFNMDSRYGAYMDEYIKMNKILNLSTDPHVVSYNDKVLKNLINWEYFYYSIEEIKVKKLGIFDYFKKTNIIPLKSFNYLKGYASSVLLPDGGHIYNSNDIVKQAKNNKNIPIGGGGYKINGKSYEKKALDNLMKLIRLYQSRDVKINFILTPYHPNVFRNGETKPVKHMQDVQQAIINISQKNHIKIYGSFFPEDLNCSEDEFFDYLHPTLKCLNKIDFSQ